MFCKYCNKEFQRSCGLTIHERTCKYNPDRKPLENHVCNFPHRQSKTGGWFCRFCNANFHSKRELYEHLHNDHQIESRDRSSICEYCGEHYKGSKRNHKKVCPKQEHGPHKWTSDERKSLSEKRKDYLKEHPNEHPWKRNSKFISKPCEHLKTILTENNIKFVSEFTDPVWEHSYSADIVLHDKKIIIEVNGNQHYQDGTLTDYYQKRHDYLESFGYTVIEFHYTCCYKQDAIDELLNTIR